MAHHLWEIYIVSLKTVNYIDINVELFIVTFLYLSKADGVNYKYQFEILKGNALNLLTFSLSISWLAGKVLSVFDITVNYSKII